MSDDIQMEPVISSNVKAIGFSKETGTMYVQFNSGATYKSPGTQADYDIFKSAKSKGSHFSKVLKTGKSFTWSKVEKKG